MIEIFLTLLLGTYFSVSMILLFINIMTFVFLDSEELKIADLIREEKFDIVFQRVILYTSPFLWPIYLIGYIVYYSGTFLYGFYSEFIDLKSAIQEVTVKRSKEKKQIKKRIVPMQGRLSEVKDRALE